MGDASAFTFVDLFAGIGGFHLGCARRGGRCLAACEIDPGARAVYAAHHGITPHDDIRTMPPVMGADLVCAGFPCQSYSTLGARKGLRDPRGKLFYHLLDFLKASKPGAFLLENVKGILSATDMNRLLAPLRALGYTISWGVLDTQHFGLPQHRERVYIVGSLSARAPFDFARLQRVRRHKPLRAFLDARMTDAEAAALHTPIFDGMPLWDPARPTETGFLLRAQRSNFTNRKLFSSDGIVGTITTGSPPPIYDEDRKVIRHLSSAELLRCQGFPARMRFPAGASRTYVGHYVGNAVSVAVIAALVGEMQAQGMW